MVRLTSNTVSHRRNTHSPAVTREFHRWRGVFLLGLCDALTLIFGAGLVGVGLYVAWAGATDFAERGNVLLMVLAMVGLILSASGWGLMFAVRAMRA